jgi:hypothetical protein
MIFKKTKVIDYAKGMRIKCDRDYNRSVPQWKGLFLWHYYTVITPVISGGYRTVTRKAAFDTANDACMFLRIAAVQEFNGRSRGTVSDEDPNFPRLSEDA